jgi:hypothetical protein
MDALFAALHLVWTWHQLATWIVSVGTRLIPMRYIRMSDIGSAGTDVRSLPESRHRLSPLGGRPRGTTSPRALGISTQMFVLEAQVPGRSRLSCLSKI